MNIAECLETNWLSFVICLMLCIFTLNGCAATKGAYGIWNDSWITDGKDDNAPKDEPPAKEKSIVSSAHPSPSAVAMPAVLVSQVLSEGKPMRMAIVVESINNYLLARNENKETYEQWAKSMETVLTAKQEQTIFTAHGNNPLFKLLDRNSVKRIVEEQIFQMKGYTRDIDSTKIGKFLNATYLLIFSMSRFPDSKFGYVDEVQGRLVNVEDASIVGVTQWTVRPQ